MGKHQTYPNWGPFYKNNWPVLIREYHWHYISSKLLDKCLVLSTHWQILMLYVMELRAKAYSYERIFKVGCINYKVYIYVIAGVELLTS